MEDDLGLSLVVFSRGFRGSMKDRVGGFCRGYWVKGRCYLSGACFRIYSRSRVCLRRRGLCFVRFLR